MAPIGWAHGPNTVAQKGWDAVVVFKKEWTLAPATETVTPVRTGLREGWLPTSQMHGFLVFGIWNLHFFEEGN